MYSYFISVLLTISTFYTPTFEGSISVSDYPSPLQNSSLWKCGIKVPGPLCDSDSLLNDTERQEALDLLNAFAESTDVDNNGDDGSCRTKGVTVGLAITKEPLATSKDAALNVTDELMRNVWKLDARCNKALMLTLSVQPNPVVKFTRYMTTPMFDDELHHIIWSEMHWLREKNYIMWIRLVLDGIRATIVDRHITLNGGLPYTTTTVSCAGHGFVILCTLVAIICSVLITQFGPKLFDKCHRRWGHMIGFPAPFPMMRFTNTNHNTANGNLPH